MFVVRCVVVMIDSAGLGLIVILAELSVCYVCLAVVRTAVVLLLHAGPSFLLSMVCVMVRVVLGRL